MYEAYNKNYDRAINLYGLAEKKLAEIPDEIEAAEFYSKVSYLYTLVKQSIVAQHYIKMQFQYISDTLIINAN